MDVRIDNLTKNKNLIESESINKTREQELNKELFDNKQIINEINIEGKEKTVPDSRHEQDLELIEKRMPPVYNRPFTGELSRAIGQLANDRGKKSEYFAPVSELAGKLLTENLDVKERAATLSDLLEKAAYYLNNRGSSIFSRQRGRRLWQEKALI
ncbi:MAG: hypothetical protein K6E91_09950 [Butyrivibrio sp.]|nr:hypothetical protein [Butyrivibrio sp.]